MGRHIDRCWEVMRCDESQTCPAYPDKGEICWEVAGTMRTSEAEKRLEKQARIARQEGRDITEQEMLSSHALKPGKLCKFIERYGTCKCCPYYLYAEKERKSIQGGGSKLYEAF
jgi:hypothetical protein